MNVTPITQNYSSPYFGSITYKSEGSVSPTIADNVKKTIDWMAVNSASFPDNAMVKLLALGKDTNKGSTGDYPIEVSINNSSATVRMPKVEALSLDNLADEYGDEFAVGDRYNSYDDYTVSWPSSLNPNNCYEIKSELENKKVREYKDIMMDAFKNAKYLGDDAQFYAEYMSYVYGY